MILIKPAMPVTEERETMENTTAPNMALPISLNMDEIPPIFHHEGGPNQQHSLCQTISNAMVGHL